MDDSCETDIRTLCCTCLSVDRKLYQLCRIHDGVNNLYWLLSYDLEAYKEGFFKDSTNLFICWECKALMLKVCKFRKQVCFAQKQLLSIEEGRLQIHSQKSLSKLSLTCKSAYDHEYFSVRSTGDNYIFIDCGVVDTTKAELVEDDEDIPLSELQNYSEPEDIKQENSTDFETEINKANSETETKHEAETLDAGVRKRKRYPIKRKRKTDPNSDEYKKYYTKTQMTEEEMMESREKRRLAPDYMEAPNKCESCIEGYKSESNFEKHKTLHVPRRKASQCAICLLYVSSAEFDDHRGQHYARYVCNFCSYSSCDTLDVLRHLKKTHDMKDIVVPKRFKKGERKTPYTKNPGSRPRLNKAMRDKPTPLGYRCSDCDKYFEDKKQRWAHIQKCHREGFKCATCGKRFSFKNHLQKHERIHQGPPPRSQCPRCGKMIQLSLMATHARLHEPREPHACAACDRRFVSRESYEVHLKYTLVHAKVDVLKFKCTMCDKGFRTRLEQRDHVNYHHLGQTLYKCHICHKPFSSHKCYIYHVRRTHEGLRDKKDKICQQCGKAFNNKKSLREHERIHTGERPLSCEVCGATFRQNASLYTHRRRVHNVRPPPRREVRVLVQRDHAADDVAAAGAR